MSVSMVETGRGRWHLSEEQIRSFDERGYLILRKRVTGVLLQRLQDASSRWIERAWAAAPGSKTAEDVRFADRSNGKVLFRIDYLHEHGETASLELLGSPQVLGAVESLTGRNFVPTYEAMVMKMQGDGEAIPWHQDVVYPRNVRIYNYDLYLDHSRKGEGALRVIPMSQAGPHDVCAIANAHGWEHPDAIDVEMEPGDVLIHDVMVVHGSARVEGKALRRTIYYEFRPIEQILSDGPWDRAWADRRMRLVPLGLRAFARQFPDADHFDWSPDPQFRQDVAADDRVELKVAHVVHTGGSYCSAG